MTKNKGGRPIGSGKLTDNWLKVAEEVLNEDNDRVLLTDEELVFLINEKLKSKEQIVDRTFQNWKKKAKEGKNLDERGRGFFRLIKKALVVQKMNLLKSVKLGATGWQGSAWVLERKCDEWNLRRYVDHQTKGKELKQVVGFTVVAPKEETEGESNDGNTDTPTT